MVTKLTSKAPVARLRSAISSGAVAIMGDAPSASVAFADCVVTTLFVICAWGWCQPPRNDEHADRVTWCTSGECSRTDCRMAPTAVLMLSTVYGAAGDGPCEKVRSGEA